MEQSKHRVLVVDDVRVQNMVMKEILKDEYDVQEAMSGAEALHIAQSDNPPELILLDIVMPEMDGFEVAAKLKEDERTRDIPVIFVTGKSDMDSRMKGWDLGGAWYITKPFDPAYVRDVLHKHFAGSG